MERPYENLANAIITQAASDYRRALMLLQHNDCYTPALKTKQECERFFHSRWFQILTNANPDYIIDRMTREVV